MKKSEIEAIPFLKRHQKIERKWHFVLQEMELSDGTVELLDVYKDNITPYMRYAIGIDQYYTYTCENKKWGKAMLLDPRCYGSMPGYIGYAGKYTASSNLKKNYGPDWISNIQKKMENIKKERKYNAEKLSEKKTEETVAAIPQMSEIFKHFVRTSWDDSIIWTHRQKDKTFLTCSYCGYRDVISGTLKKSKKLRCAYCGKVGTRHKESDYKKIIEQSTYYNDVRPCDKGVAIISVYVTKRQQPTLPVWFEYKEIAAEVFLPHRKTVDEYWIENGKWKKGAKYEYGQYGGWGQNMRKSFPAGPTPNYAKEILKKSGLKYTGWEYYGHEIYRYLRYWQQVPKIELLSKAGLCKLITYYLNGYITSIPLNMDAKSLHEVFGVLPGREKLVLESEGDPNILKALQLEPTLGKMKPETLKVVGECAYYKDDLVQISRYVSMDKAVRYLQTQTETERMPITTYVDYLNMRDQAGYPMDERLFPRDLIAAHDELVFHKEKSERDKQARKYEEEYGNIRKSYQKLNRIFTYKNDDYIIRPARSCKEILDEGAHLHHCVGASDVYINRHNRGKSYILFLRKAKSPKVPFATIEISPEYEIKQWYEAYDKKPDEDVLQPFLNEYVNHLKGCAV